MYCRGDGEEEVVVAKARRNQYKELVKGKLYRKQKSPPSKALVCDEACFSAAHTRHTSPAKLNQIMRRFGFPKREKATTCAKLARSDDEAMPNQWNNVLR